MATGQTPPTEAARDQLADERDRAADQREHLADQRDRAADLRKLLADERELIADERDRAADGRDQDAELRELLADGRVEIAEHEVAGLRAALEARAVIQQAKGMIMLTLKIDADAAFDVLVRRSRQAHMKVAEVAREVVDTGLHRPD